MMGSQLAQNPNPKASCGGSMETSLSLVPQMAAPLSFMPQLDCLSCSTSSAWPVA